MYEDHQAGTLRFLNPKEIKELFGLTIYHLTYMSIIDAIPPSWRKMLKAHQNTTEETDEEGDYKLADKLLDTKRPSKLIYDRMINNKSKTPTKALKRWKEELGIASSSEVLRCHYNQRSITINHKLKSFNYMFLIRNIPYGSRLYKMEITDTENCTTCNIKESLTHLYWDCPNTARLWERLKHVIEHHLNSTLILDKARCMLGTGTWTSKRYKERIWFLCILTKHYIHLCKCNESETTIIGYENYLKSTLRTEKSLAQQKGTINLFTAKWGLLMTWIDS